MFTYSWVSEGGDHGRVEGWSVQEWHVQKVTSQDPFVMATYLGKFQEAIKMDYNREIYNVSIPYDNLL